MNSLPVCLFLILCHPRKFKIVQGTGPLEFMRQVAIIEAHGDPRKFWILYMMYDILISSARSLKKKYVLLL